MTRQHAAAPSHTVFEVQSSADGTAARWIRVEAPGPGAARAALRALGESPGDARLVEVRAAPTLPGTVTCPQCMHTRWTGGRGALLWLCVVLLFPVGLLLLFVRPRWTCASCGYTYAAYSTPTTPLDDPDRHRRLYWTVFIALSLVSLTVLSGLIFAAVRFFLGPPP